MEEGTELVDVYDYLFKLVVIGEAGTGKSCLLHRCIHDSFKEESSHTIGVEFSSRTLRIGEKNLKLQLWDTAGQERFRSVTKTYYRGAAGAVLVYDITSRKSFANLEKWLEDCRTLASPHLVTVLVGNKLDQEHLREVAYDEGARWAQEHGLLFSEVSSLTGENALQPLILVARTMLQEIEKGTIDPNQAGTGVSYGERQLRAVGSGRRRRRSISLGDLPNTTERYYVTPVIMTGKVK